MAKKGTTIRFDDKAHSFFERNSINIQSLVTRLVDKHITEKELEQKKIEQYNNLSK